MNENESKKNMSSPPMPPALLALLADIGQAQEKNFGALARACVYTTTISVVVDDVTYVLYDDGWIAEW